MPVRVICILLLGFPGLAGAEAVAFKRHESAPGTAVRITARTTTNDGQITIQRGASEQKGTMNISRDRLLVRRIIGSGATAQVEYQIIKDRTNSSVTLGGPAESETADARLAGQTALGFRDTMGRWRLYLKGRTAMNAEAVELAELEAYENRRWYVDRPVSIGESWPIDPGFIRHLAERDIGDADLTATATLKEIATIDGEKTAVITMKIESTGSRENADGNSGAGVILKAGATLHVSLATMLDKRLVLEGTLITVARDGDQSTTVGMPMRIEVSKSAAK